MLKQTTIKKGTFQHVESELYSFQDTQKEIVKIKNELLNDQSEQTVVKIMKHRMLEQMEHITDAIENVVGQLPQEKQKLIKLRYWTRPQLLTWDGVAIELDVGRATAIRWRDEIVIEIAKKIGWR
ncbi:transcriptional regulator [Paenibacillus naphthalenovorans]|uniref:transcriptional regulator n=1 Tax=Paenibacillus naphthalenovorans TaxID=162209 RepID=UPI000941EE77|nr:transcriptional regulator [Paenibacillus naphthalenovorans]